MMLHSMGDSHSDFSFRNLPVERHPIGAITMEKVGMQRTGTSSSEILDQWITRQDIPPHATLILSFGEIDIRCQVQRQIDEGGNAHEIIRSLAHNYIKTVRHSKFQHTCITSITPPWRQATSINFPMWEYPVIGTDEDRARWTVELNALLEAKCDELGIPFLNIYPGYTDKDGMLIESLADTLHIGDTTYVGRTLQKLFPAITQWESGESKL